MPDNTKFGKSKIVLIFMYSRGMSSVNIIHISLLQYEVSSCEWIYASIINVSCHHQSI